MLSVEEVLDIAEEIFSDLAPDNLSKEILQELQNAGENLFIEVNETFSDWEDLLHFEPELDEFLEVDIFMKENDDSKKILAKILLGLDEDEKECHVLWELSS